MPILGRIVKLVGSGVGLARESYIANKESKTQARSQGKAGAAGEPAPNRDAPIATSSRAPPSASEPEAPPEYVETTPEHADELIKSGKAVPTDIDEDSDNDEEEWRLDEAAEYLDPPSYEESEATTEAADRETMDEQNEKKWVRNVMILAPAVTGVIAPLPVPVVLPQRRPRDKARGFVRAYAPILDSHALNQRTFMEFLKCFHMASKASKGLQVVFLSATIVGFVPEVVAQIVSTVVQVGAGTAMELQRRHRANSFLDEMNEKLFKPRGLYAIVMAYKPNATRPISAGEFDPAATVARYNESTGVGWRDKTRQLRVASGQTYNDLEIGETAPLVFPAVEQAKKDPNQSKWKSAQKFMGEYADKRANAVYAQQNPDSKLAAPAPTFRSRYSDPNHPANDGTIISLITGGMIAPGARKRARREQRRQRRAQTHAALGLPAPRDRSQGGFIKKALTEDVLYLMIVNMPSPEELARAKEKLAQDKLKAKDSSTSSGTAQSSQSASNSSQPGLYTSSSVPSPYVSNPAASNPYASASPNIYISDPAPPNPHFDSNAAQPGQRAANPAQENQWIDSKDYNGDGKY